MPNKPEQSIESPAPKGMLQKAIIYAIPQLGVTLMLGPIIAVLGGIYAKYYGLALTSIATVMLVARLFDAITDPLIGYWSDRWRAKTGSRKAMVLLGSVLMLPTSYCLFVPPAEVGVAYFTFWYMAFYLALTLFVIPYLAWANEFTRNTREKTLVFSAMAISGQGGGALFYLLPLLPFFASSEITPEILQITVIVGAVLFLPGVVLACKVVPDGRPPSEPPAQAARSEATHNNHSPHHPIASQLLALSAAFINNRPFLLYVAAFMCLGIGVGMWAGMFFIFVDTYLHLGERFSEISLWGMVCGICATPIWYRLAIVFGKRQTWLGGMVLLTAVFVFTGLLNQGQSGFSEMFMVNMLMTFASASMAVIAAPMLCDVIDYGRLSDASERSALYFSIQALMTKVQLAIGGAIGMGLAGWFGFDMQAAEQSGSALFGLRLSVAWGPVLFTVAAMVFIARMPLSEGRMAIIRRRLERRDKSLAALAAQELSVPSESSDSGLASVRA